MIINKLVNAQSPNILMKNRKIVKIAIIHVKFALINNLINASNVKTQMGIN